MVLNKMSKTVHGLRFVFLKPPATNSAPNIIRTKHKNYVPNAPHTTPFGLLRILMTVIPGLLIGAAISKHIANFLEENDLFVPSDDDDDDD